MTGIVDYNAGNIRSVERALASLKAPFILSKKPSDLALCDRLIFPGVGDAAYAMQQLKLTGFDSFLREWALANKPLVGICLGSQIIFEYSEEGGTECLGILKGKIRHFENVWKEQGCSAGTHNTSAAAESITLKVPHMGWNNLSFVNGGSPLFNGVSANKDFYFVHSYLIQPTDSSIIKATADYGCKVPACVSCGSVTAFQFHPEKSGLAGMQILRNYVQADIGGESC